MIAKNLATGGSMIAKNLAIRWMNDCEKSPPSGGSMIPQITSTRAPGMGHSGRSEPGAFDKASYGKSLWAERGPCLWNQTCRDRDHSGKPTAVILSESRFVLQPCPRFISPKRASIVSVACGMTGECGCPVPSFTAGRT